MSSSEKTTKGNYSAGSFIKFINTNFLLILIGLILFASGWFSGSLWQQNQLLKKGSAATVAKKDQAKTPPKRRGPSVEQLNKMPNVSKEDHVLGDLKKAKVVLVEYSDLECPFCKRFHQTTNQVLDNYGGKVALVWRSYPLPFHPSAQKAAETAECVAQNAGNKAFWQYLKLYFDKTDSSGTGVSPKQMLLLAQKAGANKLKVADCIKQGAIAKSIKNSINAGSAAGISGTPGTMVVVNGKVKELIPGALPYAQVKQIIDKYVK